MTTKKRIHTTIIGVLLVFVMTSGNSIGKQPAVRTDLQVPFLQNVGQIDPHVAFYAQTFGGTVFVTSKNEIVYSLPDFSDPKTGVALREVFLNGQQQEIHGEGLLAAKTSYFNSPDSTAWRHGIPSFESVSLGEVFPGIEVKLRAHDNNVEKLFFVGPNVNPGAINLKFEGVKSIAVGNSGELAVETALGLCTFTKPVAYQTINGENQTVCVDYVLKETGYGFKLGQYDANETLIIDPLLASTFVGGSSRDESYEPCLAIDSHGNVFFSGETYSGNFPMVNGAYHQYITGSSDRVVAKYSSDLSELLATTFIGGTGADNGMGICIDGDDNVCLAGYTASYNFPTTEGAYDESFNGGGDDAFIAKLDNDLTTLLASTYFGGSFTEGFTFPRIDIAIGIGGNIYVAGLTNSPNLPMTPGAYSPVYNGSQDFFVAKFSPDLSTLMASTFLGGNTDEWRPSIQIDAQGSVFVGGTSRTGFPVTTGSFDHSFNGGSYDMVVAKLSGDLTQLLAATYIGSPGEDNLKGLRLDSEGNLYTAGLTSNLGYPTVYGAYDRFFNGGSGDFAISKLSNDLSTMLASTVVGGRGRDNGQDIFLDQIGNVHVVGSSSSPNLPVTSDAFDVTYNGSSGSDDAAYLILTADLSQLVYATYFGSGNEFAKCVVVDNNGSAYISGVTTSALYPTTPGVYDNSFGYGGTDCFIAKFGSEITGSIPNPNPETGFRLDDNYPNPFNPSTTIAYAIAQETNVTLSVFDLKGRLVKELVNNTQGPGEHQVRWDGCNSAGAKVSSGSYTYLLTAGDAMEIRKMNLIK